MGGDTGSDFREEASIGEAEGSQQKLPLPWAKAEAVVEKSYGLAWLAQKMQERESKAWGDGQVGRAQIRKH